MFALDPILLVEIGGTHTRCAVGSDDRPPERVALFRNADYDDVEAVITAYLGPAGGPAPRRAALAVAAPVEEQPITLTNLGWTVDAGRLASRFGWADAAVINDFEALACAVPALARDELRVIHPAAPEPDRALAVLGPGTGLGVSGLVPCGDRWFPISGEGGHVTLAPFDDRESKILQRLRRDHGHASAERVLSGAGLLLLYRLLAGDDASAFSPDEVTRLANAGDDHAAHALDQFFLFLGTVAADLALTLGARGGLYLGGGILPAMAHHLLDSGFAERFVNKGRFGGYLERIPVYLITAETPALRGIARHPRVARRPEEES